MLALHIKSVDYQQQLRSFHCQLNQLETVLDTLSLIAAAGNVLLEVYIIEDGHRTNLSPQAFDGEDLGKPIRDLEREWEAILSPLHPGSYPDPRLPTLELMLQRIDQYESRMAEYDSSITKLKQLFDEAQAWLNEGSRKDRLLIHYQTLIARHQTSIDKALAGRDKWLDKLSKLK